MTLQILTLLILSCFQYHIITSHTLYGHTNKTTLQTFMKCLKDPSYSTQKTTKGLHHFVLNIYSPIQEFTPLYKYRKKRRSKNYIFNLFMYCIGQLLSQNTNLKSKQFCIFWMLLCFTKKYGHHLNSRIHVKSFSFYKRGKRNLQCTHFCQQGRYFNRKSLMYSPLIVSESSWNTHWRIHLQTQCTKLPELIFNPYRLLLKTIAIAKLLQWPSRWPLPMASFTSSSMRMTLWPWHSHHSRRKCTSVALPTARRLQSTYFSQMNNNKKLKQCTLNGVAFFLA